MKPKEFFDAPLSDQYILKKSLNQKTESISNINWILAYEATELHRYENQIAAIENFLNSRDDIEDDQARDVILFAEYTYRLIQEKLYLGRELIPISRPREIIEETEQDFEEGDEWKKNIQNNTTKETSLSIEPKDPSYQDAFESMQERIHEIDQEIKENHEEFKQKYPAEFAVYMSYLENSDQENRTN